MDNNKGQLWLLSALVLLIVVATLVNVAGGCGAQPTKRVVVEGGDTPAPPPATDGSGDGGNPPPPPPSDQCQGKTQFADLKPLVDDKCVSCHQSYSDPAALKAEYADVIKHINLGAADPERMPKKAPPRNLGPLSNAEKALFNAWKNDGYITTPDQCARTTAPFLGLLDANQWMRSELDKVDQDDRVFTRFVVASNKLDEGADRDTLDLFRQAVDKALNHVNTKLVDLAPVIADPTNSVYRIDLRDYGLTQDDWKTILAGDKFKIVDKTDLGKQIRQLTGTDQPWLHANNLADLTQTAAIYYKLTKIPATFAQFTQQIGANFAGDLADGEALLLGFNSSPISEQKNRLVSRHETIFQGKIGSLWCTYDVQSPVNKANQQLTAFPLLKETGSVAKVYNFQASECIHTLPNGLMGYSLWLANGLRQDFAALDIVSDNQTPLGDKTIRTAESCHRCHNDGGLIVTADEVRAAVEKNAVAFLKADLDRVKLLYKSANVVSASFTADKHVYNAAEAELHIAPGLDPLTMATDDLHLNYDAAKVAGLLFLSADDFKERCAANADCTQQAGSLLTGGTVTLDQLLQVFPKLRDDLHAFDDDLNFTGFVTRLLK